ncbi:MAG: prepilin-type N-terminal cleavage/methylation domain-containing protein [Candidatus Omnitrophica bacterium]|nr:prepilin-type N-terminal cleavage/methylation domain-containing protein [Candidatus Omnitrophota bacterium]MCM8828991.1 prepilin-type N-terminal cleavage/methylation domain-containing protein [Candidatus Omnitrophota bacterium]
MTLHKTLKKQTGVGLIELMVVLVLGSLGIFAVSSIVIESYKEWKRSNEVAALQVDFDLASHMIKSIVEEASEVEIINVNHIVARSQSAGWIQEFYQASNKLIWKNSRTGLTQNVVSSLKNINFSVNEDNEILMDVYLEVEKNTRVVSGNFSIFMRNS